MSNKEKLENLTNKGMIDQMYHEFKRFETIRTFILGKPMYFTTWQRWIRR